MIVLDISMESKESKCIKEKNKRFFVYKDHLSCIFNYTRINPDERVEKIQNIWSLKEFVDIDNLKKPKEDSFEPHKVKNLPSNVLAFDLETFRNFSTAVPYTAS